MNPSQLRQPAYLQYVRGPFSRKMLELAISWTPSTPTALLPVNDNFYSSSGPVIMFPFAYPTITSFKAQFTCNSIRTASVGDVLRKYAICLLRKTAITGKYKFMWKKLKFTYIRIIFLVYFNSIQFNSISIRKKAKSRAIPAAAVEARRVVRCWSSLVF
jgi:hypothetical protein